MAKKNVTPEWHGLTKPAIIPLPRPGKDPEWRDAFRGFTMKRSFMLGLSHSMIELLCAIADDVTWDRSLYPNIHFPDNWYSTTMALEKRGLIEQKSEEEREAIFQRLNGNWDRHYEVSYRKLTPAGEALVHLLRVTGLFIQADSAVTKKEREKREIQDRAATGSSKKKPSITRRVASRK